MRVDEPSSIIAHTLSSPNYVREIAMIRKFGPMPAPPGGNENSPLAEPDTSKNKAQQGSYKTSVRLFSNEMEEGAARSHIEYCKYYFLDYY